MYRLIAAIVIFIGTVAHAQEQPRQTAQEQLQEFARDRYQDTRDILLGPRLSPNSGAAIGLSCHELYERRVALWRATQDYAPKYFDDPRNKAAVILGSIFTPAYYYLPYSALSSYLKSVRKGRHYAEIETLRDASAQQDCFVHY